MRRREIEKLPTVSIRSRLYVEVDALLAALEAEERARADAETETPRSAPRKAAEKGVAE
ncbi:MAG: hypothetical protein KBA95_18550 [Acidobacteria bacterium]|nr:hypothetical protein [Acidobacteriota bacterium]